MYLNIIQAHIAGTEGAECSEVECRHTHTKTETEQVVTKKILVQPSRKQPDLTVHSLLSFLLLRRKKQTGIDDTIRFGKETDSFQVSNTGDEFRVNLDVAHFSPEEIHVKTVDNKVVIHAKHEEKEDEHGYIMREFRRSYLLPKVRATTDRPTPSSHSHSQCHVRF